MPHKPLVWDKVRHPGDGASSDNEEATYIKGVFFISLEASRSLGDDEYYYFLDTKENGQYRHIGAYDSKRSARNVAQGCAAGNSF